MAVAPRELREKPSIEAEFSRRAHATVGHAHETVRDALDRSGAAPATLAGALTTSAHARGTSCREPTTSRVWRKTSQGVEGTAISDFFGSGVRHTPPRRRAASAGRAPRQFPAPALPPVWRAARILYVVRIRTQPV
jgi:hypothetical protein